MRLIGFIKRVSIKPVETKQETLRKIATVQFDFFPKDDEFGDLGMMVDESVLIDIKPAQQSLVGAVLTEVAERVNDGALGEGMTATVGSTG